MGVDVSPGFVLFWSALYFFDSGGLFWPLALSAAEHELCHLAAIRLSGGDVSQIRLRLNGAVIVTRGVMSYRRELVCAAAGPAGSAALAALAARMGLYTLSGVNAALFVFNILPVMPLDGGRMLYCVTASIWGGETGEKVTFIAGLGTALTFGLLGIWTNELRFVYFAIFFIISCCQLGKNGVKFRYSYLL